MWGEHRGKHCRGTQNKARANEKGGLEAGRAQQKKDGLHVILEKIVKKKSKGTTTVKSRESCCSGKTGRMAGGKRERPAVGGGKKAKASFSAPLSGEGGGLERKLCPLKRLGRGIGDRLT